MGGRGKSNIRVLAGSVILAAGLALAHDEVPELPFPHVQDPLQCGIPETLGGGVSGVLDGRYQGVLGEPEVHLYDSHLRGEVVGHLPHGSPVLATMFQDNPVLDFYYVVADTEAGTIRGWLPGPFLDLTAD